MELTERHLESIIRTEERVKHIDEKVDSISESLEKHDSRIAALEKQHQGENAVASWRDMTFGKVVAAFGAAGGIGAVIGWILSLVGRGP